MPPSDRPVVPRRDPPDPGNRLTRRRLLAWSALVAAAPLGTGLRPAPATADGHDGAYGRAFEQAVAADPNVRQHLAPGREFLYRPGQLLVANLDTNRVLGRLRELGYPAVPDGGFAGVTRLRLHPEIDVPAVVSILRDPRQWPNQPVPQVQPHHVLVGFGNIMGNPGSAPRYAAPLAPPDPTRAREGAGVTVGICDTGIWRLAADRHPAWLGGSYLPQPDDEDPLYLSGDLLALQGGHGTFVAGVVRQAACGVRLDPEAALTPTGLGDEEMLVRALSSLTPEVSVVNLSLGCFTQDDQPSLPLAQALAARPSGSVVVAAAGNAGTDRPAWPAAFPDVLAVAAVSRGPTGLAPAPYSNFGRWVDVCADGDRTSTYVHGLLLVPGEPAQEFTGFATWAGTSFATAHVSGRLAALMTTAGLTAEAAQAALLAAPRWHPDYGVLVD